MTDDKIALPTDMKLTVGPAFPPPPTVLIQNPITGRHLLSIHQDGTVTGEIEDASEAARVFVDHIRHMIAEPQTDALKAEIERLREIVYRYVDPFDVVPEDEDFVQAAQRAALEQSE